MYNTHLIWITLRLNQGLYGEIQHVISTTVSCIREVALGKAASHLEIYLSFLQPFGRMPR
jgi:hypothetical protein